MPDDYDPECIEDLLKKASSLCDDEKVEIPRNRKKDVVVERIIEARRMHPGSVRSCLVCDSPIFDEGECPNCS